MKQNIDNHYRHTNNIIDAPRNDKTWENFACHILFMSSFCFFFQLSKWFYMKHLRDPKIIEATTAMATQTTSDVDTWVPLHGEEAKAWGTKASSTSCGWEITYGYRTCRCCCTPISIADYWIDVFRVCSKNVNQLPFCPMAGFFRA